MFEIVAVRAKATGLEQGEVVAASWGSFKVNNGGATMGRGGAMFTVRGGDLKKVMAPD